MNIKIVIHKESLYVPSKSSRTGRLKDAYAKGIALGQHDI
jgi:hypothetical protein